MRKANYSRLSPFQILIAMFLFIVLSVGLIGCVSLTKQLEKDYQREVNRNNYWRVK